jgi:hypothetical protein
MPQGTSLGSNVTASIVQTNKGAQTDYVSIKFTGNITLQPGEYVEVQTRFNKSDWSSMTQSNDWSYTNSQSWQAWTRTTAYSSGALIWGQEPPPAQSTVAVANVMTYPNPATSATGAYIQYSVVIPAGGIAAADADPRVYVPSPDTLVYLKIFTPSGRLIWQQVLTGVYYVSTGEHTVKWDGRASGGYELAAGSYILKIVMKGQGISSEGYSTVLMLK